MERFIEYRADDIGGETRTDSVELPAHLCADTTGAVVDGVSFEVAREFLDHNGLSDVAASLEQFEDVYRACADSGQNCFFVLSNRGGEIRLLSHGRPQESCALKTGRA